MKELNFVLVGVNLNFAGMLLWLMASAPGKGEIHYLKECFHKALKVKQKITYENELVLDMYVCKCYKKHATFNAA